MASFRVKSVGLCDGFLLLSSGAMTTGTFHWTCMAAESRLKYSRKFRSNGSRTALARIHVNARHEFFCNIVEIPELLFKDVQKHPGEPQYNSTYSSWRNVLAYYLYATGIPGG